MEEEQEFKQFAAQPDVQQRLFSKIAPQIFGHDDIKKAVACLLFGGARKVRGDAASSLFHAGWLGRKAHWACTCSVPEVGNAATALFHAG